MNAASFFMKEWKFTCKLANFLQKTEQSILIKSLPTYLPKSAIINQATTLIQKHSQNLLSYSTKFTHNKPQIQNKNKISMPTLILTNQ